MYLFHGIHGFPSAQREFSSTREHLCHSWRPDQRSGQKLGGPDRFSKNFGCENPDKNSKPVRTENPVFRSGLPRHRPGSFVPSSVYSRT